MELSFVRGGRLPNWFSVYDEGRDEALKFKWIESEKARCDLGVVALRIWSDRHWRLFLRSRWLEHLEGKRFCAEFHADQFGLLQRPITDDRTLLEKIVEQLRMGYENLEIICWAVDWQVPCGRVREILTILRVNDARLPSPFEHLAC